ncbi:hypothetical protein ACFYYY_27090 [Streptomyces sp. NPDC001834]|uniref:hypothetical protein n=1 Tax=Streptomyces sp. NPDC001834 TaxID=3364616 RepID=UPI003685FB08
MATFMWPPVVHAPSTYQRTSAPGVDRSHSSFPHRTEEDGAARGVEGARTGGNGRVRGRA